LIISCSQEDDLNDIKSSSLIKPNFLSKEVRYDCIFNKDASLNRLEAFIPNFVNRINKNIKAPNIEFLFNQQEIVKSFTILYSAIEENFNADLVSNLLIEEGINKIANCNFNNNESMLSARLKLNDQDLDLKSFEVEILKCRFNDGFNYGTFAIEVDTFFNIVRKKNIDYFARFLQKNDSNSAFVWMNYIGSAEDKEVLYKDWLYDEDSLAIQNAFNIQAKCESSMAYKGYKVL